MSGPAPPADLPFDIVPRTLEKDGRAYRCAVVTAKNAMVVGRERIAALRKPTGLNDVERAMIRRIGRGGIDARIVLFRAMNDAGARIWRFDPNFADGELEEAGYVMTGALLPFHRELVVAGVVLMVHTDWGIPECHAMRHGVRRFGDELAARRTRDPQAAADHWIMENMLLHVALSLDHVVEQLLPDHLGMIDRRQARVRKLVASMLAAPP